MSTYVRQAACGTFEIPSSSGPIKVHGGPLYPSVMMPVSDQTMINNYCDQFKTESDVRECKNVIRNKNMVDFIIKESPSLRPQYSQMLIQDLGTCQSQGLKNYIDQVKTNNTISPHEVQQLDNILKICNL